MAKNVEIKARANRFDHQLALAKALADGPAQILKQRDVFYHCPNGRLKLRFEGEQGYLVSYRRPDQGGPKLSDYQLAPCADPAALDRCLQSALGFRGVVEKTRTLQMVGQTRIHFDEVMGLGFFLELEVVLRPDQDEAWGREVANRLMARLEIREQDLTETAYMDLLEAVST